MKINGNAHSLSRDTAFMIPPGNCYEIENMSKNNDVRLLFILLKSPMPEEEFEVEPAHEMNVERVTAGYVHNLHPAESVPWSGRDVPTTVMSSPVIQAGSHAGAINLKKLRLHQPSTQNGHITLSQISMTNMQHPAPGSQLTSTNNTTSHTINASVAAPHHTAYNNQAEDTASPPRMELLHPGVTPGMLPHQLG